MRKLRLIAGLLLALLGATAALPSPGADDPPPATAGPAPAAPAAASPGPAPPPCPPEGPAVAIPTVAKKKHTRICYECKEEDYCRTRCVPTPILTSECHGHGTGCGCPAEAPPPECNKCGPVRTRKVLIK